MSSGGKKPSVDLLDAKVIWVDPPPKSNAATVFETSPPILSAKMVKVVMLNYLMTYLSIELIDLMLLQKRTYQVENLQ